MTDYITFAQLADALRRCGNGPTVADCKGCAFYRGPDMSLCIPEMTARAAQVIELFAAEPREGCGDIGKYKMD
jgi:hypothetical protein|nr:MAG TPA: hypothetical protein [Caudoviricetes sp.]